MSVNIKHAAQAATLGNIKKLDGKTKKPASVRVPEYLSKSGSIFNAPETDQITKTQNTENKKTNPSIFNNTNNLNFITSNNNKNQKTQKSDFKYSGTNGLTSCLDENVSESISAEGFTMSNAMSKVSQATSKMGSLRSDVGKMQNSGNIVKGYGEKSLKLQKQLDKADDKFIEKNEKQKKQLEQLQKQQQALITEMDHNRQDLDALTRQLENELASDNPDQSSIATCRAAIAGKQSMITVGGNRIYIVSRSSQNLVNQMNQYAKNYRIDALNTQKEQEAQKSAAQKVIEVSTTVGVVAQGVDVLGGIMQTVAKIFDATGYGAAIGAVLETVGTTVQAVGKWGKCASDTVNTVAYASEGQIGLALCSAASAVATGASAMEASKFASKEISALNKAGSTSEKSAKAVSEAATKALAEDTKSADILKATKDVGKGVEQIGQQVASYEQSGSTQTGAAGTTKPKTAAQLAKEEQARQNAQLALNRYGRNQYSFA